MIKRIECIFPEWCKSVVESDEYAILDTETTGLGSGDQIIELSIINRIGNVLYDSLLCPSCPIGEGAMQVHRITEEMVAEAPTFADAWTQIEEAITGRKIIAWNAAFDARMLVQTAKAHGIILKDIDFYCAMRAYSEHYQFQKWAEAYRRLPQQGIDDFYLQQHRALGDVLATLEVIRAVAKKVENWHDPSRRSKADRDHIANVTHMIKGTYEAYEMIPSQIGRWDRLTSRFGYGTM